MQRMRFALIITMAFFLAGCAWNKNQEIKALKEKIATLEQEAETKPDSAAKNALGEPPDAKPGSCYKKCFKEPEYVIEKEKVLVSPATERVEYTKPVYKRVEEQVLVRNEFEKQKIIPAQYEWRDEKVLVNESFEKIQIIPAKYKEVTEKVLVQEGYTVNFPSTIKYETVKEKVLVAPSYKKWVKKMVSCTPTQKIEGRLRECETMCLVEVPAKYKVVAKRHPVKIPGGDKQVNAVYRKMKKRVLVAPETTKTIMIPARYKTVKRKVMVEPSRVEASVIPAKYKTVGVKRLAEPIQEKRIPVPARYETVSKKILVAEGKWVWCPATCKAPITKSLMRGVQQALLERGYDPGVVDGIYGCDTKSALTAYQKDRSLSRGLNIKTLRSLGLRR